jgi:hypothetical protein
VTVWLLFCVCASDEVLQMSCLLLAAGCVCQCNSDTGWAVVWEHMLQWLGDTH